MAQFGGEGTHRSRPGRAPVALTKFSVPRIPSASVRRNALLARLDPAEDCPLTLVVAAPGSGKSALLAQWVGGLEGPVAWMSCDATDAEPVGFWRNLATAVELAWPSAGMAAAEFADTDRSDLLAVGLANELGSLSGSGVIVVDDFHLTAPGSVTMQEFVAALPPQVRLVLCTRHDPSFPLGRLRLQGRLLELRQADLRFTEAEAHQLLAGLGVDVDQQSVEQIVSITEGWTAGLHLAGLWLRGHGDADRRDAAGVLVGLAESSGGLVDFLMNEVIEVQPPEIVEFLMVTAQLESFDATLCDAIRDRHDSAEMLRRVQVANLFLTELDRVNSGYRYHPLFTRFLHGRLSAVAPERIPAVHRAAATAYANRGDLISAVRHSMRAGDTDQALVQLESYATGTWSIEDQMTGGATVRAWLQEQGAQRLAGSPAAILACTIVLNATGHGDYAEHWLRAVEAREPELDAESRFLLHGAWSFDLLQHGDPVAAIDHAQRSQKALEDDPVHISWVDGLPNVMIAGHMWLDDLDAAEAIVEAVRIDPARPPAISQVRMPAFGSHIAALRGELADAQRLATAALTAADQLGLPDGNFGRAEPHLSLGMVAIERYDLAEAEEHLERAMRIVEGGRRPPVEVQVHLELVLVAQARGDKGAAAEALDQAREVLPRAGDPVTARIDQVALRLALDHGDRVTAKAIRDRLPPSPAADLLAARARLAAGDPAGALAVLDSMTVQGTTRRHRIERELLCALSVAEVDASQAQELLYRALVLARPAGFHRTFIAEGPALWGLLESLPAYGQTADYVADLLHTARGVLPPSPSARRNGLVEPLSDRELTVLRYLASRLTSTEIASELYLSVNTVRSHIKAVYRKLGVNSRTDAVRRGHTVGVT